MPSGFRQMGSNNHASPQRRRGSGGYDYATTPRKSAFKALSKENNTPHLMSGPVRNISKELNMSGADHDDIIIKKQGRVTGHKNDSRAVEKKHGSSTSNSSNRRANALPSTMKEECIELLRAKQYRSCEILTMFYLSSIPSTTPDLEAYLHKGTAYEILGDCALNQEQTKRALSFYKKALSNLKCLRGPTVMASIQNILQIHTAVEANIKLKEARALAKLGNTTEASSILDSAVPRSHPLRTFAISMELGEMYIANGRTSDAKNSYLDALGRNPYAFEAVEKLVMLNAERSEVMKVVNEALKNRANNDYEDKSLPVGDIITAYFYSNRSTNSHQVNALGQWKKLHAEYPKNIYILLQIALLQTKNPTCDEAHAADLTFQKIRDLDYHLMEGMDSYATILAKQCNVSELGRLSSDLLAIDDKRPEAWFSLAMYHDSRGDSEKALMFIDKAISCDSNNASCHMLKGSMLLSQGRSDMAGSCFFRANEIKRDIASYEGLVESCLRSKRYKEAICTAKEAMAFAPRDSRALCLVGLALSRAISVSKDRDSGGQERAKKALRKAIALDPLAIRPLLALADLYMADGDIDSCIDMLKKSINDGGETEITGTSPMLSRVYSRQVILNSKLGDVYSEDRKFEDAISCYHKALSMNPDCVEARRGLENLEHLMRGGEAKSVEEDEYDYPEYNDM